MMKKHNGFYDLLLAKFAELNQHDLVRPLATEASIMADFNHYLVRQLVPFLLQHLSTLTSIEAKLDFINQLLAQFSQHQFSNQVLIAVNPHNSNLLKKYQLTTNRLAEHAFFTNASEQTLIHHFLAEMTSCHAIILIYPFISKAMINKLYQGFDAALKQQIPIKIITTTFDDTARFVNLYELSRLVKKYPNIEIRIEDNREKRSERIHIKAALFHRDSAFSSALLGSSNLTVAGMEWGREWNLKLSAFSEPLLYQQIWATANQLWDDGLLNFNDNKIQQQLLLAMNQPVNRKQHHISLDYYLYDFQLAICQRMAYLRQIKQNKQLIVMATGTGKTVVAAFDYLKQCQEQGRSLRILFLAHQIEIVTQALATFQQVLKDPTFGVLYQVKHHNSQAPALFATIQTVYRHLATFQATHFDLIIFDEAHHIAAKSFAKVFQYFQPQTVIGLTATPERADNQSILPFFGNEYAYELRIWTAINQRLLAKFDYYCIDDITSDLTNLDLNNDWQVFQRLNHQARNQLLLSVIENYIGRYHEPVALIFCINIAHAKLVCQFLQAAGLNAAVLTSQNLKQRAQFLRNFQKRKINYLCVVNIFNEGIDVPEVDTIILLRPTNSRTIYLQQIGRGLRKTANKQKVAIYDLIGNIDAKYDLLIGLRDLITNPTNRAINPAVTEILAGQQLPAGCTLTLEPKSQTAILKNWQSWYQSSSRFKATVQQYYQQYQSAGLMRLLIDYQWTIAQFYQTLNSFYLTTGEPSWINRHNANETKRNQNLLKQFLFLNSYQIVVYFYRRLNQDANLVLQPDYDNLLLCSLFYEVTSLAIYQRFFANQTGDLILNFITQHQMIVAELLIILKYKLDHETLLLTKPVNTAYPLLIPDSCLTVRQGLCAIGHLNFLPTRQPLKIITFQAGFLTFDHNSKTVIFADIGGLSYGKKTHYQPEQALFDWSIPESKGVSSKLVADLSSSKVTKMLFLHDDVNQKYSHLKLKLYRFVGFVEYQQTMIDPYVTIRFKIKNGIAV